MEDYNYFELYDERGNIVTSSLILFSIENYIMLHKGLCANVETVRVDDKTERIIYTFPDGLEWTCIKSKWN